jgi:flagellar M-ring protein FliF
MSQIEGLVKSAMGYDAARGDQVQVTGMAFAKIDTGPAVTPSAPPLGLDSSAWFKIIEVSILSLTALLMGFFVARPLISRMFAANPVPVAQIASGSPVAGQLPAPAGSLSDPSAATASPTLAGPKNESMIDISRIEGQVRESSVRKVGEVVQSHPEEALAILRTWLHQPV